MSSIDQIKPLLIGAVVLIGLVAWLAALRRNGAPRRPARDSDADQVKPDPQLERMVKAARTASAHGADWAREADGSWQRVDAGAIPPIDYPPDID